MGATETGPAGSLVACSDALTLLILVRAMKLSR